MEEQALENLCYYDRRNPDCVLDPDEDTPSVKGKCYCCNCFYGRTKLAEIILTLIKQKENGKI